MEKLKEPAEGPSGALGEDSVTAPQEASVPSTSLRLFLRARRGEGSAIDALFGRLLPSLNRWARGRLPRWARRRADTEDLVQDAFGALLRRLPHLEPRRKKALRIYLQQAIRNRIRDEVRRAGKVEVTAESDARWPAKTPSPLDRTLASEDLRRYRGALSRLSPGNQELVVGRLELAYTYEQLALVTGKKTPDAARMATKRALLRLAEDMGPE